MDGGQSSPDLLMNGPQAHAVLPAYAGRLLLVDDVVQELVQEDGQLLPFVIGYSDVAQCGCRKSGRCHQGYRPYLDVRPQVAGSYGKQILKYYDTYHHVSEGKPTSTLSETSNTIRNRYRKEKGASHEN